MKLAVLLSVLALAGCAMFEPADPEKGDKPGSFKHLVQLKQSFTLARREGREEDAKRLERQFYERVRELRQHGAWLRENGHPGRATAVEARLKEILEN